MSSLLQATTREAEEVKDPLPAATTATLTALGQTPVADDKPSVTDPDPHDRPESDPVERAYVVATALAATFSLEERISIYSETGRRILYIAAARWPELMPMLNDDVEWRALLSADLG